MIKGINHINIAVQDIEKSFDFYKNVLGFKPLCLSENSAYFLAGNPEDPRCLWFSLDFDRNQTRIPSPCNTHIAFTVEDAEFDVMVQRILGAGVKIFKENTSPGKSLYFFDPDQHKLEIHTGSWQERINTKKAHPGNWKNIKWFV